MTREVGKTQRSLKKSCDVARRIAEAISEQIISGSLSPDALLRQDHVARQFDSSHGAGGLSPIGSATPRCPVLRRGVRVAPLNAASVKEIIDMRAALKVVALRSAAPKFTSAHLAAIELALLTAE